MLKLSLMQQKANKYIAKKNKDYIIHKLEEYFYATSYSTQIKAKEYAILAFWQAKRQGRLDNLNRIVKINQDRTL